MTDDNSNTSNEVDLVDIDDQDAFEADFFQIPKPEAKEEKKEPEKTDEVVDENEDDHLAPEKDTDADEDEKPAEDEEDEKEPEKEPAQKPKSKTQQRIEKLLEKERLANERADALERRLAALESGASKEEKTDKEAIALRDNLPDDAPNPDAVGKDGNPIYPLGEFDPKFIRDITKYSVDKELAERDARLAQEQELANRAKAQEEIRQGWTARVEEVEKEIPDLREHITDLTDTFKDIPPEYGDYLATVIMASERGPEIMYYLSQNIGEAQKIVASGPTAALLSLGRLEAKLSPAEKKEEKSNKRQSHAPAPPENRSRGSGGKFSVPADTDDQDAFEREFFQRK